MENNKLIPLTEFIKQLGETSTFDTEEYDWAMAEIDKLNTIRRYANFLSQPLTLGQFIPCDEEGNVFSEPVKPHTYASENADEYIAHYRLKVAAYNAAKERVLFEGVELDYFAYSCILSVSDYQVVNFSNKEQIWQYKLIEEMVNEIPNLTLTPTALKMIYGRDI